MLLRLCLIFLLASLLASACQTPALDAQVAPSPTGALAEPNRMVDNPYTLPISRAERNPRNPDENAHADCHAPAIAHSGTGHHIAVYRRYRAGALCAGSH